MKTLVLFDLDDTLVQSHFLHIESFYKAFVSVYGVEASIEEIYSSGLTTQAVVERTLELHKVSREEVLEKIKEAVDVMANFFEKKKVKVLPGVKKLLNKLSKNKDVILGVATGAAEKIGINILKNTGLLKYFPVKAFGDNIEYRREIIKNALEQAGTPKMVIIGDSIHDVQMAKVFNAKCIAVATGETTKQQLKAEDPDYLFNDLNNTDKVIRYILK